MRAISPVVPGLEKHEIIFAKEQPEYEQLPTLRSNTPERIVMSRWRPTDEERRQIAAGADIHLSMLTFGEGLQPILLQVHDPAIATAEQVRIDFRLTDADLCGHKHLETRNEIPYCLDCNTALLLCAECTMNVGGNRAVYHAPPLCKLSRVQISGKK